jgi:hypothetical protein
LNAIDDVDSAMTVYLDHEFPSVAGERYLWVYGVLQGMFVQQDGLRDLIRIIHPAKAIDLKDVLEDVREARNQSVGHPTHLKRRGAQSTHGIVQVSLRKEGFELDSFPERDGKVFQYVPVRKLVEKQRLEAARILTEVVDDLIEQEKAHRAAFRDAKLKSAFDQVSYAFEKIFEELRDGSIPILSKWAVGHLQAALDQFGRLLVERGLSADSYDSVKHHCHEIEHPLTELRKYLEGEPSEILSKKTAAVFAQALTTYFTELVDIAEEIDEEYSSAPAPVS